MATGGTTNLMPIVGEVDARLRTTLAAIQKWLKGRIDTFVVSKTNVAPTGFQANMRAYGVPAVLNQAAVLATHDNHGQWLIQNGVTDVVFNAGGDGTITFPYSFPNACTMAIGFSSTGAANIDLMAYTNGLLANGFNIRRNAAVAGTIRVNWIAFGY